MRFIEFIVRQLQHAGVEVVLKHFAIPSPFDCDFHCACRFVGLEGFLKKVDDGLLFQRARGFRLKVPADARGKGHGVSNC